MFRPIANPFRPRRTRRSAIPFVVFFCFIGSCKEQPVDAIDLPDPPLSNTVRLSAVDSSLSQTWLRLKFNDASEPRAFQLLRDGIQIAQGSLNASSTADTLIVDSGLTLGKSYRYSVRRVDASDAVVDSAVLTVNTLDSTSHNFVWTTETLGGGDISDVCILNDTCAFAVGEIYRIDSVGQLATRYTFAKWNGKTWTLSRAISATLNTVFAFSENDVWAASSAPYHWDGVGWTVFNVTGIFNGYVSKMWGTSSQDLYMVGTNGSIAHYDGVNWKKMESGTSVDLTDIFGTPDGKHVWACGGTNAPNLKSVLLQLVNGQWQTVYAYGQPHPTYVNLLYGLWTSGSGEFVVAGSFIYRHSLFDLQLVRREMIQTSNGSVLFNPGAARIRGSAKNNVAVCGYYTPPYHWNGISWQRYELLTGNDRLYNISVSENQIMAVGTRYTGGPSRVGLILRGKRP